MDRRRYRFLHQCLRCVVPTIGCSPLAPAKHNRRQVEVHYLPPLSVTTMCGVHMQATSSPPRQNIQEKEWSNHDKGRVAWYCRPCLDHHAHMQRLAFFCALSVDLYEVSNIMQHHLPPHVHLQARVTENKARRSQTHGT